MSYWQDTSEMEQNLKNILVIQLRQLGDILLTTPVVRTLKEQYPEACVTFLCHPMGKMILDDNPYIDVVITYNPEQTFWEGLLFLKELRARSFDVVFDYMYNPRSALFSLATGAERRVSFESQRGIVYTKLVKQSREVDYVVRRKFELLKAMNIPTGSEQLILPWGKQHLALVEIFFKVAPQFEMAPIRVSIAATHRRKHRRWDLKKYAALADMLVRKWDAQIIWLWAPGEEEVVDEVMDFCEMLTFKSPQTKFRELAAMVSNCDLFIGNSNGSSHVAVAAGIHSLQLHGPSLARSWCPVNDRHHFVRASEVEIDGVGDMKDITIEAVWNELEVMKSDIQGAAQQRQSHRLRDNWQSQPY